MTAAHEQKRWMTENAAKITLASALIRQHRSAEGAGIARQGLEFYEARGYRRLKLAGHSLLLDAAIEDLDTERGSALAADYLRDARALGDPQILSRAIGISGHFAILTGDWPRQFAANQEMREIYRRLGRTALLVSSYYNEANLRAQMGEVESVTGLLARGKAESAALGKNDAAIIETKRRMIEARFANHQGRYEEALALDPKQDSGLVRETALVMLGRGREAWQRLERGGPGPEMTAECRRLMALTLLREGRLAQADAVIAGSLAELPPKSGRAKRFEHLLVRAAIAAAARSPEARPARAELEETFAAMSATWTEEQRERFRVRPGVKDLWPVN